MKTEHGNPPWSVKPHLLYGCGRDALAEVLLLGRSMHGWRRVWIPDYMCQEVVAVAAPILDVLLYPSVPTRAFTAPWESANVKATDAVLVVNHFGLRSQVLFPTGRRFHVIEDHTHDPASSWAASSQADYAIASLRKTLPIPDGAVLWAPLGGALPAPPPTNAVRVDGAEEKLRGMVLKAIFLAGGDTEKQHFREYLSAGEVAVASGVPSSISSVSRALLSVTPWRAFRRQRAMNFEAFREQLNQTSFLKLLEPESSQQIPFSCVLVSSSEGGRASLRDELLKSNIYPAVLWSLEAPAVAGMTADALWVSRRVLSIPCDHRYSRADMLRVARAVNAWQDATVAQAGTSQ